VYTVFIIIITTTIIIILITIVINLVVTVSDCVLIGASIIPFRYKWLVAEHTG